MALINFVWFIIKDNVENQIFSHSICWQIFNTLFLIENLQNSSKFKLDKFQTISINSNLLLDAFKLLKQFLFSTWFISFT